MKVLRVKQIGLAYSVKSLLPKSFYSICSLLPKSFLLIYALIPKFDDCLGYRFVVFWTVIRFYVNYYFGPHR